MTDDKPTHQERLKKILHSDGKATNAPNKEAEAEEAEVSCSAFGYLRGAVLPPSDERCDLALEGVPAPAVAAAGSVFVRELDRVVIDPVSCPPLRRDQASSPRAWRAIQVSLPHTGILRGCLRKL